MKKRTKGREKKREKKRVVFRNGTVNAVEQFFPPIRLTTGLEVRRGR